MGVVRIFVPLCMLLCSNYNIAHQYEKYNSFLKKVRKEVKIMEKWIGQAIALMHMHGISQVELGQKMGLTNKYISLILLGKRKPPQAKERILGAINEIIAERNN